MPNTEPAALSPDKLALIERSGHGHRPACRCTLCQNKIPLAERLAAKIRVTPAGCWEWTLKGRAKNRNADKTVCDHGHPFTPENTIHTRVGTRQCRECHRQKLRRLRTERKAS